MKTALTQGWQQLLLGWGLLLPALSGSVLAFAQTEPAKLIKIKEQTFERRRPADGTMTWIMQKTIYEDGSRRVTPAGVQFEDALGLSILLIDDATPDDVHAQLTAHQGSADDTPQDLTIQLRSLMVELKELQTEGNTQNLVPRCENGRVRAVVFVRPRQLARQLALQDFEAQRWSRFGRAACVRWSLNRPWVVDVGLVWSLNQPFKSSVRTCTPSASNATHPQH